MAKKSAAARVEKEETANAVGRPSSFDADFLRQAEFLCERGAATDQELAEFFQVTPRTIQRWKIQHPEFLAAMRRGKDVADERIENALYHKAQDREVEEEQAIKLKTVEYHEGKRVKEEERVQVVTVRKFIPGDTTAMIFWLKNRRPQEWRDVHKHEHGKAGAFDQMDDKQLDDYIEGHFEEVQQEQLPPPDTAPEPKRKGATKH